MNKHIENEIIEVHRLFQGWYNGTIEKAELDTSIGSRLSEQFYIVFPDATKNTKNQLLDMMRNDYDNDKTYRIEIKDLEIDLLSDALFLASYQEWQYWDDESEPKLKLQSTSILRLLGEKSEWLAIHETQIGR